MELNKENLKAIRAGEEDTPRAGVYVSSGSSAGLRYSINGGIVKLRTGHGSRPYSQRLSLKDVREWRKLLKLIELELTE